MLRHSKFRHVFGCPFKKEVCYEQLRVTKSAHDNNFCAVNPLFLAVVVESSGGGAFIVLPLNKTGRSDINTARVCGHKAPVTDIKFNLHDDYILASASDDCTIKIWQIPPDGITEEVNKPLYDLRWGHQKRVSYVEWHPTVSDVLLSAGVDQKCLVWDVKTESIIHDIDVHPDNIFSISWNFNGSLFATTCKDKKLRVLDPRAGVVVAETVCQQGSKASKVVFLKNGWLVTTGFMRSSERQVSLWDWRDLSKPLKVESIDNACGILFPFYDSDLNIVYLAGKGDGNIRYMEIIEEEPYIYFLNQFQSSIPQSGLAMMNKRGLDVKRCEIARFFKLHSSKDICEPISMIVPRKSEWFQADIYPPTTSPTPSSSLNEWLNGINKDPLLVSAEETIGTISERLFFLDETNEETYYQNKDTKNEDKNIDNTYKSKTTTSDYNNNSLKSGFEKETIDAKKQSSIDNHKRISPNDGKKKLTRSHASRSNTFSASTLSNDVTNYHHPAISRNANKVDGKYRPIRRRRPSYNDDDDDDDDDSDLDNNEVVTFQAKKDIGDVSLNSLVLENKKYDDTSNKIRSENEIRTESNEVQKTKDCVDNESLVEEENVSFSDCVKYFEKDNSSKPETPMVSPVSMSKDSIQKISSNFKKKTNEAASVAIKCSVERKGSIVEKIVDNFDNGLTCKQDDDESNKEDTVEHVVQSAVVQNVLLVRKKTTDSKDENNSLSNGDSQFSNSVSDEFEQNKGSSKVMLDCISVDAPDDALILPSSLRASMSSKHRRVVMKNEKHPNNQSSDFDSDLKGLIRVGSVRERSRTFNKLRSSYSYNRPQSVFVSNRQGQTGSSSSDENRANEKEGLDENNKDFINERPTHNTRPKRSLSATRSHEPSHESYSSSSYFRFNQSRTFVKDAKNSTVSNGPPGKSLKDLKKEISSVSVKTDVIENSAKEASESTETSIDSTKTTINAKLSKDERSVLKRVKNNREFLNSEVNNSLYNNHSSIKSNKVKKSEQASKQNSSSLSHSELLQEHQRQQCEIKQLKKLLEQKDLKIKKLETLLQQKAR